MAQESTQQPFKSLGKELRRMRELARESIAEVSGAVEIDARMLAKIELGEDRPSEDVLLLLMSHFELKDEEATKLWELAGYTSETASSQQMSNDDKTQAQVMVMPNDVRVVYTDLVHVMVNNYGVVMNFMQGAGPNNQPLAVARIGMSREHAKSVLQVLKGTLEQAEKINQQKQLPLPKDNRGENKKKMI